MILITFETCHGIYLFNFPPLGIHGVELNLSNLVENVCLLSTSLWYDKIEVDFQQDLTFFKVKLYSNNGGTELLERKTDRVESWKGIQEESVPPYLPQ